LSGAGFGAGVSRPGSEKNANVGHFFAAIKVDQLRPLDVFKQDMDQLIRQLKGSPRAEGQDRVFIPGEKEFECADLYMREGVPVYEEIVALLQQTGRENGVAFDLSPVGEKLVEDKDSEM
jgi:L-2-hydroxycarboxylate dehydrogenase (NAD+)